MNVRTGLPRDENIRALIKCAKGSCEFFHESQKSTLHTTIQITAPDQVRGYHPKEGSPGTPVFLAFWSVAVTLSVLLSVARPNIPRSVLEVPWEIASGERRRSKWQPGHSK